MVGADQPLTAVHIEREAAGGGSAGLPPPSRRDFQREMEHTQVKAAQNKRATGPSHTSWQDETATVQMGRRPFQR